MTSNAVHPGTVATDFARDGDAKGVIRLFFKLGRPFLRTSKKGAATSVYAASAPELAEVTGKYFKNCRAATPDENRS